MSERSESLKRKGSILNFRTGKVQEIKEKHIVSINKKYFYLFVSKPI